MARKTDSTSRIAAQGGHVSAAIRAVRDPVTPCFVPVRAADPMTNGFYVARRWEWADGRREVISLDVREIEHEWSISMSRCGAWSVEDPADWQFLLRVDGICSTPADLIDITTTRH